MKQTRNQEAESLATKLTANTYDSAKKNLTKMGPSCRCFSKPTFKKAAEFLKSVFAFLPSMRTVGLSNCYIF